MARTQGGRQDTHMHRRPGAPPRFAAVHGWRGAAWPLRPRLVCNPSSRSLQGEELRRRDFAPAAGARATRRSPDVGGFGGCLPPGEPSSAACGCGNLAAPCIEVPLSSPPGRAQIDDRVPPVSPISSEPACVDAAARGRRALKPRRARHPPRDQGRLLHIPALWPRGVNPRVPSLKSFS